MISKKYPFYTYRFGKMGRTMETARQTGFFQWFHMVQDEQTAEEPGRLTHFRPEGRKFHDLCFLDALEALDGRLVQLELVVSRRFIESRDWPFAQDLVKSFLVAALPDACQHVLSDLMQQFETLGASGVSPGFLVYTGRRNDWSAQTGWSRLSLKNAQLNGHQVFAVNVCPNPGAPNATLIGGKPGRMRKLLALFGLTLSICACHKQVEPGLTLKGTWTAAGAQVSNCGKPAPVSLQRVDFVIKNAPLLTRTVSSFDLQKADVTGTVTMELHMEGGRPITATSGLLVGEIVNSSAAPMRLQGYILSEAEYGAWISKDKKTFPPTDAGEVDLEIAGNPLTGYTLAGDIRSSEACGNFSHLDSVAGDLTGHFGRGIPAEWSAKMILHKQ